MGFVYLWVSSIGLSWFVVLKGLWTSVFIVKGFKRRFERGRFV